MIIEDIQDFAYHITGNTVIIHCHVKDSFFAVEEGMVIDNMVMYSWGVPVSEIEGMEDPTDYLKAAIVAANAD